MTEREIIEILESSGALLNGHFQLRSGLHSNRFFQAALLLQYPDKAETVCRFLAEQYKECGATAVISPAVGGLIVGIIAIFAYNYLVAQVDKVQNMMEADMIAFLEIVAETGNGFPTHEKVTVKPAGDITNI